MFYGYHRVSTREQHLDRGITGIESFCKDNNFQLKKIYVDIITGKTFDRPRYIVLKEDVLRKGDTLILFELDRLGRTKTEIITEISYYIDKGIRLIFLDIPTTTIEYSALNNDLSRIIMETVNNVLIEMLSMIAQTELERKQKRCDEGRMSMKKRGDWDKYGRPRIMSAADFAKHYIRVEQREIRSCDLMRELNLKRDTYFRYVREYRCLGVVSNSL